MPDATVAQVIGSEVEKAPRPPRAAHVRCSHRCWSCYYRFAAYHYHHFYHDSVFWVLDVTLTLYHVHVKDP